MNGGTRMRAKRSGDGPHGHTCFEGLGSITVHRNMQVEHACLNILQCSILRDGMSVQICLKQIICASATALKLIQGSVATMCTYCKSPTCSLAAAQVEDMTLPPKRSFRGVPKLVEQFLDALATGQAMWKHQKNRDTYTYAPNIHIAFFVQRVTQWTCVLIDTHSYDVQNREGDLYVYIYIQINLSIYTCCIHIPISLTEVRKVPFVWIWDFSIQTIVSLEATMKRLRELTGALLEIPHYLVP